MNRRGRGWTWTAALFGLGTAAAIPVLGVAAARTLGNSTTGQLDVPSDSASEVSAETPGALLVQTDGNEVVGLTVFAIAPQGAGGTAVVVPAGSKATVDGFDRPTRLANAFHSGGMDAEVTAAEGLLGVTFSDTQQTDQAGLQRLFTPLGPIAVNLPGPVVRTGALGQDEQLLPAGPQTLTAAQAAAALFARKSNESELVRLPNEVAIWNGVVQAAERVKASANTSSPPPTIAGYLAALGAGPRTVRSLNVTPAIDVVNNPDSIDLLQVDSPATNLLMAEILPTAISPTNGGLRVVLRNRTGDDHALYDATARLLFAGANLVAVDSPGDQAPATGTVMSYDPSLTQDRIEGLTVAIGPAVASPAKTRLDGVDVTIDLGTDFLGFLRSGASASGGGTSGVSGGSGSASSSATSAGTGSGGNGVSPTTAGG
jgi:hypothetical protein